MMTPRTPLSPHGAEEVLLSPFNLHTPHTPLYLLSPSADATAYSLGGGTGVLASYHSITEVAATGGGLEGVFTLESLQALVAEQVQAVLGNTVGGDDPLMAAGLDSLGSTELQQSLADALGVELPSTLVFDYPTVNAMAEFLAGKLSPAAPGGRAASPLSAQSALAHGGYSAGAGAVAIVGAAGQHELQPAGAPVADAAVRVPYGRWDADSPLITADGTLPAQVGEGAACV